jgi:hypothetical protein
MKTNAPGCNCCDRVLVWDMGVPFATPIEAGISTETQFADFGPQQAMWSDLGVTADFALGSPKPSETFWGPMGPVADDGSGFQGRECPTAPGSWGYSHFDPFVQGVDQGYWTGDVYDYTMLFWMFPLGTGEDGWDVCFPGTNRVSTFHPNCPALQPDNWWVPGGEPAWYEDVFEGTWEGRVVLCTATRSSPATNNELFRGFSPAWLNTLPELGLVLDHINYKLRAISASVLSPLLTTAISDLTEGVGSDISWINQPIIVPGADEEILFNGTIFISPPSSPCTSVPLSAVANIAGTRKLITKTVDNVDYYVELVNVDAGTVSAPPFPHRNPGGPDSQIQFHKNLLGVPLLSPPP